MASSMEKLFDRISKLSPEDQYFMAGQILMALRIVDEMEKRREQQAGTRETAELSAPSIEDRQSKT